LPTDPNNHRTLGLDIPRALAVSLVVLSHVVGVKLQPIGVYGVELFFAISGFLIGGIIYKSFLAAPRWSFRHIRIFWARRWWRTLPNYYLFLVVFFCLYSWRSTFSPISIQLLRDAHIRPWVMATVLQHLVFIQNLLSANDPLYGVSWSLAIEEWFYLLFPLSLLLFSAFGASKRNSFLMTMMLFITVAIVAREIQLQSFPGAEVRLMTIPRMDAVFYGVAVAFWHGRYGISANARRGSLCIGVFLVILFSALVSAKSQSNAVWALALVALPAGFALTMPYLREIKSLSPRFSGLEPSVRRLSLWSYSIYLSHIPVLDLTYAAFGRLRGSIAINILAKCTAVALCLVVSKLIYKHFELPLTSKRPAESAAPNPGTTQWLNASSLDKGETS
jgi:peptidoglycan/LPS O-acetylase OafA/YrhL